MRIEKCRKECEGHERGDFNVKPHITASRVAARSHEVVDVIMSAATADVAIVVVHVASRLGRRQLCSRFLFACLKCLSSCV